MADMNMVYVEKLSYLLGYYRTQGVEVKTYLSFIGIFYPFNLIPIMLSSKCCIHEKMRKQTLHHTHTTKITFTDKRTANQPFFPSTLNS